MSKYDVIIIGGGPAGISAAIWCADLGLRALLAEKEAAVGGQLSSIYNPIRNYPGVVTANGTELSSLMARQLQESAVEVRHADSVAVDLSRLTASFASGEDALARSIVIATGVRRRKLEVPGEEKFAGKGILRSGSESRNDVADKRVVVIGGGDAAAENALILSEQAREVTLIHRGPELSARPQFVSELGTKNNIRVLLSTRVSEILGEERLEGVQTIAGGVEEIIRCENLVIRIGVEPNSDLFRPAVACDDKNYILTDANAATNVAGVYAVGDVASPKSPTIATAVGMGATAVKNIYELLKRDPG